MKRKHLYRITLGVLLLAVVVFFAIKPKQVFHDPTSTVLLDENGHLLSAQIAADGQWRFPLSQNVSEKFKQSIILFEDEYFYWHPGINPVSIFRALRQNIEAGEVKSGGSTISMQVIRLSRKGKPRTIRQKIIEIILALRLELHYSKDEILALYAANAPFGGNVVGLDAAAWRYYGRSPEHLSWGEAATLAVLPNAPSLIFPGKNQSLLFEKRNRLLTKLEEKGLIDDITMELAMEEPLPGKPKALPRYARHLMARAKQEGKLGERVKTTINQHWQERCETIIARHHYALSQNEIHNAAAIIIDVETGEVKAYVGNVPTENVLHGTEVDVITAPRSTGSILKPLLYASMMHDGELLPKTLVPDIPTQIAGYAPENFDYKYRGAVHADEALAKSLNIPAVRMLQDYGLDRFYAKMQKMGFTTLTRNPDHYGLSLILGGAEATLWDLVSVYASMARSLNNYYDNDGMYNPNDFRMATYQETDLPSTKKSLEKTAVIDAGASWLAFNALQSVTRPREENGWEYFRSSRNVAWKTGTSFGYRDAWAVGITPKYVIGVWVGNADGEGRPGMTGIKAAAPVLFDLLKVVPASPWFTMPMEELQTVEVCRHSGHIAGASCEHTDTMSVSLKGTNTTLCPYHQTIHVHAQTGQRVNMNCTRLAEIEQRSWFVLPAAQAWYYKNHNMDYQPLPKFKAGCNGDILDQPMDVIYPKNLAMIKVPVNLSGEKSNTIFRIAHNDEEAVVYWHIDEEYMGSTSGSHKMALDPEPGEHLLTLVDDNGYTIKRKFEIIGED